jgi:hypothetical protein
MVGNASLLICHLSTSRPSLPRVSCTGYQAALRLQSRSFVAARLARSLFRRGGRSGHALCEPRGGRTVQRGEGMPSKQQR